jgi:hypothetical protein
MAEQGCPREVELTAQGETYMTMKKVSSEPRTQITVAPYSTWGCTEPQPRAEE